jgi:hypothetical protein
MLIRILPPVLLLSACLAACQPEPTHDTAGEAASDTAPGVRPLSPAEIGRRAEPMTPEQAESLGVVDTTIQVGEEP